MKNFPTGSDPRQTARTAINQCKGSDENRGHARVRVCNTSVCTALACRICLYCDKPVKWRRFPPQETLPRGPSFARVNALRCFTAPQARFRSIKTTPPSGSELRQDRFNGAGTFFNQMERTAKYADLHTLVVEAQL